MALRASEKQYRQLFELNPNPMWIFDEHTLQFLAVNDAAVDFYGWSRREFLRMSVMDVRPPEEVPKLAAKLARQRGSRAAFVGEWRHWKKDHTLLDVEVTISGIQFRGRDARLTMVHDVTERKLTQEALSKAARDWQGTFDGVSDAIFLLNTEQRIVRCNRAAAKLFRRPIKDIVGRHCWEVVHQSGAPIPACPFRRIQLSRRRESLELELGEKCFQVNVDPLFDESGNLTGAIHFLSDITERKQGEVALRATEAKFRRLYESMRDAFVSTDMSGRITDFNSTYQNMLGYSAAELRRLTYVDLTPEKWRRIEAKLVRERILPRGYSGVYEKEYRRKDGTVFPVELSSFLIRDEAGMPAAMWAIVRDITARKQAEAALRESEENFRGYFENAAVGMAQIDPALHFQSVNRRFCEITGYSRKELLGGMGPLNLDHPEDLEADRKRIRRFVRGKRAPYETEKRYVRKDGSVVWVRVSAAPVCDPAGKLIYSAGVIEDITARKQAEAALVKANEVLEARVERRTAALRETEQRYRRLVEVLPDAMLVVKKGCIILANPAAQQLFDAARPEQLVDRPVLERFHPQSHSYIRELLRQAHQHFLPLPRPEQRILQLDGTLRDVQLAAVRLADRGEKCLLLVLTDVTERRQLEKQLLEIAEHERHRIGQDLHDGLCQHLTALKFKTALLERQLKEKCESIAKEACAIKDCRLRQNSTLELPAGFARIEAQLNDIIEEVRTLSHGLAPSHLATEGLGSALHDLAAQVHASANIDCKCLVDKDSQIQDATVAMHLYRIAQEAVNNAVKHSRGTRVWVRLTRRGGRLTLTVRDNGVGFSFAKGGKPGSGLNNMDYRAQVVGGTLTMKKMPSGGMQVACSLPHPSPTDNVENVNPVSYGRKKRKTPRRA